MVTSPFLRLASALAGALAVCSAAVALSPASSALVMPPAPELAYWAVQTPGLPREDLTSRGFDVANDSPDAQGRWQVVGAADTPSKLAQHGWKASWVGEVYAPVTLGVEHSWEGTYYGGYHTPSAHWDHLRAVESQYPALAKVHALGPSYLKSTGRGGHDILAICLTQRQQGDCELAPNPAKPTFVLMAQAHARELATGEVAWRWIDDLVQGYGSDREITELLNTRQVWVVPIVNPDGVDKVAEGRRRPILQRKNMNPTDTARCGSSAGRHVGVDLNRNMNFNWKGGPDPCDATWPGPRAGSEPETMAMQRFFNAILPDLREDDLTSPARPGAQQVVVSLHSYGDMVLHAWGYTRTPAPDGSKLTAIGRKLASWNRYRVGTPGTVLGYTGYGSADDYVYGARGVPFFTYEMGGSGNAASCGGFTPAYRCVEGFYRTNRPTFLHLLRTAHDPWSAAAQ